MPRIPRMQYEYATNMPNLPRMQYECTAKEARMPRIQYEPHEPHGRPQQSIQIQIHLLYLDIHLCTVSLQ